MGFAPTVVTSKPTPSTPSSVIDAGNSAATTTESAYTSTNVVTVPAIVEKKRIAPTITYSSRGSSCSTCGSSGFGGNAYYSKFSSGFSGSGSSGSSSSSSSSGSSGFSNSGTTGSSSTTKTVRKITRTITSHRNEAVDPISA